MAADLTHVAWQHGNRGGAKESRSPVRCPTTQVVHINEGNRPLVSANSNGWLAADLTHVSVATWAQRRIEGEPQPHARCPKTWAVHINEGNRNRTFDPVQTQITSAPRTASSAACMGSYVRCRMWQPNILAGWQADPNPPKPALNLIPDPREKHGRSNHDLVCRHPKICPRSRCVSWALMYLFRTH